MHPSDIDFTQERLAALVRLAALLEHFETGQLPLKADQYRSLVRQLKAALRRDIDPAARQAVLDVHPAAAELYENMNYEHAGLARATLDRSVASERLAAQLLARARRA